MRSVSAAFAICIAASLLCASVDAVVACNTGFVEFACPDDYPTCCSWKRNGVIAACCPARATCELEEGECLISNTSNGNVTKPPQQGGITVGVSEAAAFITFAAIGFIVGLVGCAFLGFRAFLFVTDRRVRRQEAERQALLQGSDDEDAAGNDDDDEDSEVDDEGQCNICYSRSVNCALMPCAHVATCRVCAARLDKCPICREEVVKFVAFKTRLYRALPKPEWATSARGGAALAADMKTEELGTNRAPSAGTAPPVSPGRAVNVNGDGDDDERDDRDDASTASATPQPEPTVAADEPEEPETADADAARAASTAEPEAANGTGDAAAVGDAAEVEQVPAAAAAQTSINGSPQEAEEATA